MAALSPPLWVYVEVIPGCFVQCKIMRVMFMFSFNSVISFFVTNCSISDTYCNLIFDTNRLTLVLSRVFLFCSACAFRLPQYKIRANSFAREYASITFWIRIFLFSISIAVLENRFRFFLGFRLLCFSSIVSSRDCRGMITFSSAHFSSAIALGTRY